MKVAVQHMENRDEMLFGDVEKGGNKVLVAKQPRVRSKKGESTQVFQSNGGKPTRVTNDINHELPSVG